MPKEYKFGFVIEGDYKSAVTALQKTQAELDRLEKQTTKTKKTQDIWGSDFSKNLGSMRSMVVGLAGVLGATMSVNYFAGLIKRSIEAQDELAKMSQRINVSVESLAGLDHAASLSGSSLQTVEKALKTVSTQMFDASRGLKESQQNFQALGISIFDSAGELRDADKVMIQVADQFAAMEDGALKTALATKLFGKSGLELIPMLNEGSAGLAELVAEGQRLNPVTAESAAQAELFNDNVERLMKSVSSLGVRVTNDLLPSLVSLSEALLDLKTISGATEDAITGAIEGAAKQGLHHLDLFMLGIINNINDLNKKMEEAEALTGHRRVATMNQVRTALEEQKAILVQLAEKRAELDQEQRASVIQTIGVDEEWLKSLEDLDYENSELAKSIEKAREETEKNSKAVADHIKALQNQLGMINRTERDQFILNHMMQLGTGATLQLRMATMALASALYDQQQAIKNTADAEKARADLAEETSKAIADANRDAAREAAEEWREFRDDFSDVFAEILMDTESGTQAIVDSFKRMGGKIIGDLLASGVMNILNPGAGGFSLSSTLSNAGTAGTITNALLGATSVGFGASQVGVLSGAAAGIGNSMIAPATAQAALGAGFTSTLTALATNPLTWAVAALAVAAKNDFWKDPDNYKRSFAGMLVGPTPGADPASLFGVNAFASGFRPQGIAHNVDRQTAEQYIDVYRQLDQSIVDLTNKLGGFADMSRATLAGTGIDGRFGTAGTFLGLGGKTGEADIAGMTNSYVMQLARHITGLDQELMDAVQSAGSAEEVISLLTSAVDEMEVKSAAAADAVFELTQAHQNALEIAVSNIRMIQDVLQTETGNEATREIERILDARQELLTSYDLEVSAARDLHEQNLRNYQQQIQMSQSIGQSLAGILTGDSSALSSADKLRFAQGRFSSLVQAAMGGDLEAGGQVANAGQTVISLAREMFASSSAFKEIFGSVTGQLAGVQGVFGSAVSPGDFIAPGRGQLDQALMAMDNQLVLIRESIAIDTINQLAQMNLKLSVLPENIASALRSIIGAGSSVGNYRPDVSASDISTYIATLPNTPDGARLAIEEAQRQGIGSAQLAASIQGLYPGVTQNDILGLASSLGLPSFADGGTFDGPATGGLAIMHGREHITPDSTMKEVVSELKVMGSRLASLERISMSAAQHAGTQREKANDTLRKIDQKIVTPGGGSSAYVS